MKRWLKWDTGRQKSGYAKMLLIENPYLLPFDCYLLRYPEGSEVPIHRDAVVSGRHYRLNVVIKRAADGGEFQQLGFPIFATNRIRLFRPDLYPHLVTKINKGTRYVLSIGWVLQ